VLNPLQKEERFNAIVREAREDALLRRKRAGVQTAHGGYGAVFLGDHRADAAKLALAVALQVGEADPGRSMFLSSPVLCKRALAFFNRRKRRNRKEERSSLIIKP